MSCTVLQIIIYSFILITLHKLTFTFLVDTGGGNVGTLNYTGKNQTVNVDQPAKRFKEAESVPRQKNFVYQNEKPFQNEAGHSGSTYNPQPVSTGLKLAYEEDEHNSSVSSVSEGMTTTLPAILSLNSNFKNEVDRQKEEFDRYIRLQVCSGISLNSNAVREFHTHST